MFDISLPFLLTIKLLVTVILPNELEFDLFVDYISIFSRRILIFLNQERSLYEIPLFSMNNERSWRFLSKFNKTTSSFPEVFSSVRYHYTVDSIFR